MYKCEYKKCFSGSEKKNGFRNYLYIRIIAKIAYTVRALSHLHVLTWRPEDVLGVHWKLPERGENAWFYLQIGFTVIHRVVSGDLKTSALRHSRHYPGLTASIPSLSRPGRVLTATTDKCMRRISSSHHVFSDPITFALRSWRSFRVRSTIRHVRMKH